MPYLDELDSRGFRYYFQVTAYAVRKRLGTRSEEKREILADVCRLGKKGWESEVWFGAMILFSLRRTHTVVA